MVGRDKVTQNIMPHPRQLDLLVESYKKELESNECVYEILDELSHYSNAKSEIRDLGVKLGDAGFDYLLEDGKALKELVSKLIVKNQNYRSAQKIIIYLLAEVESIFNCEIKPKLLDVRGECEVKALFRMHLEKEINDKLGENVLDVYHRQINGMVYFLTGNCHLEWK